MSLDLCVTVYTDKFRYKIAELETSLTISQTGIEQ